MTIGMPSVPSRDEEERKKRQEELERAKKARKVLFGDDDEDEEELEFDEDEEENDYDSDDEQEERKKKRKKKKKKKLYKGREWLELVERLHQHRVIFISDEITDELANYVCGLMTVLSKEDPKQDIFLVINSCGGKILPALAIYDTMQSVQAEINTICFGQASATASLILAGGEVNKRLAAPHCKVRLQRLRAVPVMPGTPAEWMGRAQEIFELNTTVANIYEQRTRLPRDIIWGNLERGRSLSAEEAKKYGIVDHILGPAKSYLAYPEDEY